MQTDSATTAVKNHPVHRIPSYRKTQKLENSSIEAGIQRGLDDMITGRTMKLTPESSDEILQEFTSHYPNIWK